MTAIPDLYQYIDGFDAVRAGVLGDLMVDRFIYGGASRISPEAPVPVVRIRERRTQPGGAANVGFNVLSLGGRLDLFGVLGDDEAGLEVFNLLAQQGADTTGILLLPDRPSTVKTRIVAQSQHVVRFDEEETGPLDDLYQERLLKLIEQRIRVMDVLIVSDYAKGVIDAGLVRGLFDLCQAHGVRTFVDPKPVNMELFAGADVIKPNYQEALRLAGIERDPGVEGMPEVCRTVRHATGAKDVVITAGGNGMFVLAGEEFVHLPGLPREVYDVAGAGDTTLAAMALGLAAGADLVTAARLGNIAGSIAVGRLGIAAVTTGDLRREVEVYLERYQR